MTLFDRLTEGSHMAQQLDAMQAQLTRLTQQGATIMALVDDLRAAQGNTNATLDLISTEVQGLNTEVQDLIARLTPGATITQTDVDAATALGAKAQAISDALKAIPPEPA